MCDPIGLLVTSLRQRGVVLEIANGRLRCQGEISTQEKRQLVEFAPIVEAILNPDPTLPDVLIIPASLPNTIAAIDECIDGQRIKTPKQFAA